MSFLTLCVTSAVIDQARLGDHQKQIAITNPSPDIAPVIAGASSSNRAAVHISDQFTLMVGDTAAIWRSHQVGIQLADFDDLYSLLARRPDIPVKFTW